MKLRILLGGLLAALGGGCEDGKACPSDADCPNEAKCRCDEHGRVTIEKSDMNKDGEMDTLSYARDSAGRVTTVITDHNDDGKIERHQEFTYDDSGQRLSKKGWQLRCDDSKFHWECTYEKPCAAPYKKCSRCPNKYETESPDGKLKPCLGKR